MPLYSMRFLKGREASRSTYGSPLMYTTGSSRIMCHTAHACCSSSGPAPTERSTRSMPSTVAMAPPNTCRPGLDMPRKLGAPSISFTSREL